MLRQLLESTKLDPAFCANLIGVSLDHFNDWVAERKAVPAFVIPELSSILGVPEKAFQSAEPRILEPAIWYKLRADKLTRADRELVGMVRKLGFYLHQLQSLSSELASQYEYLFNAVRKKVDRSAHPVEQGRTAAQVFRSATALHHGQRGIGEALRSSFRTLGLLVIESPLKHSAVEGCSFLVGTGTPCVFANSYKSTWFRRNAVLAHEVGHVIFDLDSEQVILDYKDEEDGSVLSELRAQSFAQELLVPKAVLTHYTNQLGIKWCELQPAELASLMTEIHVEQRLLLNAARDWNFIDQAAYERYSGFDCHSQLRQMSSHALSTREYLQSIVNKSPKWIPENLNTRLSGARSLRLPAGYVSKVIEAYNLGEISLGKAAEMTMMDEEAFCQRFSDLLVAIE